MSVFSIAMRRRPFTWQISAVCFVLGGLLSAAVYTSNRLARSGVDANLAGFIYTDLARRTENRVAQDSEEIKKLREDKKQLEEIIAKGNDGKEALNAALQEARSYAGLTEVTGPGVVITLQDSRKQPRAYVRPENYLIHENDINVVINELRSAGAEAIAVGEQRVVNSTAVRCVGPVAMVNEMKEGAPFVIRAIGDPATLLSALNIPNGVLESIRREDPIMARAEAAASLRLPAFSGSTQRKWARTTPTSMPTHHTH